MSRKKTKEIKATYYNDDEYDDDFSKNKNKPKDKSSKTPVLDSFSKDITKLAEEGKIETIVGREREILRVSQILARKKKNNPILIGEPGCVDGTTLIQVRRVSETGNHNIVIK